MNEMSEWKYPHPSVSEKVYVVQTEFNVYTFPYMHAYIAYAVEFHLSTTQLNSTELNSE